MEKAAGTTSSRASTIYVPIKDVCEELTAYGFSYKWGNCNPIIQPWRLVEAKARKVGMLFEGERAIRRFWEENVRSKLSDAFYKKRDLMSEAWVMEARKRCGFDGPDYKDRFASTRRKFPNAPPPSSWFDDEEEKEESKTAVCNNLQPSTSGDVDGGSSGGGGGGGDATIRGPQPLPLSSPNLDEPEPSLSLKKDEELSETALQIRKAHQLLFGTRRKDSGHKSKKRKKSSSSAHGSGEGGDSSKKLLIGSSTTHREGGRAALEEVPTENNLDGSMRIAGANWMETKAQTALFETLFAKASALTPLQLEHTTKMLQQGDPKVIGLLRAHKDRDDSKSLFQFKRILDSIISDSRIYGHPKSA